MPFIDLDQIEAKEIVPGYRAMFVHSDNMTLAYWTIEAGADLPEHSHPHEQVANVLEGTFELTIAGETRRLEPGAVAAGPSFTLFVRSTNNLTLVMQNALLGIKFSEAQPQTPKP